MRKLILHECPTCSAPEDLPCRTPKGRKKEGVHDARPFSIVFTLADEEPDVAPDVETKSNIMARISEENRIPVISMKVGALNVN